MSANDTKHPESALAAFSAAAARLPYPPRDPGEFFRTWLRRARRLPRVPRPALNRIIQEHGGFIVVLSFGGISGVTANDVIVAFLPEVAMFPAHKGDVSELAAWLERGRLCEPMLAPDTDGVTGR